MDHELTTMWLSVDPMADKYPSISPYAYCAWNPLKLVDPDGNEAWKPDENRNLVAEKGDNAWTLATYLNTTPDIATNMLEEQGYSINSKGVLNLIKNPYFRTLYTTLLFKQQISTVFGGLLFFFAPHSLSNKVFSLFQYSDWYC